MSYCQAACRPWPFGLDLNMTLAEVTLPSSLRSFTFECSFNQSLAGDLDLWGGVQSYLGRCHIGCFLLRNNFCKQAAHETIKVFVTQSRALLGANVVMPPTKQFATFSREPISNTTHKIQPTFWHFVQIHFLEHLPWGNMLGRPSLWSAELREQRPLERLCGWKLPAVAFATGASEVKFFDLIKMD